MSTKEEILQSVGDVVKSGPTVHYSARGDCIKVMLKDEDYFARRYDDMITIYYSQKTKKPIGLLLKGIAEFSKRNLGVRIALDRKKIRPTEVVCAHAATIEGDPTEIRDAYGIAEEVDEEALVIS